ncbi:ATP-grasp domain-containing protein [Clostridium sp. DJ247]|uniref:ATP-grasp domain-containing protein n=1 Tax=Clostridium sp. DJ247 TaxID=2726188 RepID=UPI0016299964|nr:ATP-grasp domain-containing protein [Clostridium sp. DJ247]MBC2581087.1 ATP-grasp domain-containing protein [Clostridium sp. DJ247]
MKVLLITGSAGSVQGWGDLQTTQEICNAIRESGKEAEILYVDTVDELIKGLDTLSYDIVWSSLYHISKNKDYVGLPSDELWVADILDQRGIPYIGPSAQTMKQLIDKSATINLLREANIPIPEQHVIHIGEKLFKKTYPWFVKPRFESESNGISERSVAHSYEELESRLQYIHSNFRQSALVEEYLPGRELTVAVIGNGNGRKILPVLNVIDKSAYKKYPLVTIELKIKNLISFEIPKDNFNEAVELAKKAADVLKCYDHVRIDMREDINGKLKVIEVNGIPGLNPIKSRSLHIHALYNEHYLKADNFRVLIETIVDSAIGRHKLAVRV